MDLLGPFFVGLYDWQTVQLCVGSLVAGGVGVEPSVNVDARPL